MGTKLTIRVDDLTYSRLESYSRINEISISETLRKALSEFFECSKIDEELQTQRADIEKYTGILTELNANILRAIGENNMNFISVLNTFVNLNKDKAEMILDIWDIKRGKK